VTTQVEVEGRVETKIVEIPDHEGSSWGPDASLRIVGQPVPRVDALDKVTGRAVYTADVHRPGMLFAALVRAPIAAGTITGVDAEGAWGVPGVVDVLVAADVPGRIKAGGVPLLSPRVQYPNQPVAAVCAETRDAAERGAASVRLAWSEAPFAVTYEDATREGAPSVRGKPGGAGTETAAATLLPSSPEELSRGDIDAGFAAADVIIEREFRTPSALHTAMEPHGAVAEWDGERLTIWESTQAIFRVRDQVAGALGIPKSSVRVIKDFMGGGFGAKSGAGAHTFVAALFARRTGRPVRCVVDREGEQTDTGHRAPSRQVVRLGAKRDGTLTAIHAVVEIPLGITGWEASPAAVYHQMYTCPNVHAETIAYVNTQGMESFRAPGHVEGAFAMERAMDILAGELAIDPLELRLRNFAATDEEKVRPYSSNELRRCYEEGAVRFGWADRHASTTAQGPSTPREPSPSTRRGFGLAAQIWPAGGGPPAYAQVRINSDGTLDVLTGTQDLGTGSRTILAQIAAESAGAKVEHVRVVLGDTERTPYAGPSWGSMTTPSVGPAVHMAAEEARGRLLEAAGEMLGCDPRSLTVADSIVRVPDDDRQLTFAEITKKLGNVMIMGQGSRGPNAPGMGFMSFGVQFAEVEVDLNTLAVRVVRIVAAHDVGRVINPLLASSQLEGGILQGLGFALFEERILDPATGRPVNPSVHDYKVPTFSDTPVIDAFCVDSVDPKANPLGARGLAEPPIIPTAPAIANAVADALGVEVNELPLTPWRVLRALGG
jgi:xanthine dehydrogenase YagR molybdenum-binding subunit